MMQVAILISAWCAVWVAVGFLMQWSVEWFSVMRGRREQLAQKMLKIAQECR